MRHARFDSEVVIVIPVRNAPIADVIARKFRHDWSGAEVSVRPRGETPEPPPSPKPTRREGTTTRAGETARDVLRKITGGDAA